VCRSSQTSSNGGFGALSAVLAPAETQLEEIQGQEAVSPSGAITQQKGSCDRCCGLRKIPADKVYGEDDCGRQSPPFCPVLEYQAHGAQKNWELRNVEGATTGAPGTRAVTTQMSIL
jgi:hypothetical protein